MLRECRGASGSYAQARRVHRPADWRELGHGLHYGRGIRPRTREGVVIQADVRDPRPGDSDQGIWPVLFVAGSSSGSGDPPGSQLKIITSPPRTRRSQALALRIMARPMEACSQMTRSLALEAARLRANVNTVGPGLLRTPMSAEHLEDPARVAKGQGEHTSRPSREPSEGARPACYLASPDSVI
ncbi:MAG: SDR family oxidoreductase [Acetobacteraceae bacterium]|nr:SDR family oxidoreductase [Acetobacteraceae bacterium]